MNLRPVASLIFTQTNPHKHTRRLQDLLRLRLAECGWSDQVRLMCRDIAKEEGAKLKVDTMVQSVTPEARRLVPDAVKKELLQKIKAILSSQMEDNSI